MFASDRPFFQIVADYINRGTTEAERDARTTKLGDAVQVTSGTVTRWATNKVVPHKLMQDATRRFLQAEGYPA